MVKLLSKVLHTWSPKFGRGREGYPTERRKQLPTSSESVKGTGIGVIRVPQVKPLDPFLSKCSVE